MKDTSPNELKLRAGSLVYGLKYAIKQMKDRIKHIEKYGETENGELTQVKSLLEKTQNILAKEKDGKQIESTPQV